ncbi:MAG: hypothetical protein R3F13_00010 [Prosthecobacter sp.]
MNLIHRLLLLPVMGLLLSLTALHAQVGDSEDAEAEVRVQYQLILPEEKTPETVKPEEHNPFESESESQSRLAPGDTEENRVRDRLLKLPVVGTKRMENGGMRVLLGDLILETGKNVPPVLPGQLVELRVKNITQQYIELAWQEKRASGLPPKLMIIPINIGPKIRYQMPGQLDEEGRESQGVNATMNPVLRSLMAQSSEEPAAPPRAGKVNDPMVDLLMDVPLKDIPPSALPLPETRTAEAPQPQPENAPPAPSAPEKPAASPDLPPPSSPAVESVVRMLFGNPTPAPQ